MENESSRITIICEMCYDMQVFGVLGINEFERRTRSSKW